MPCGGSGLGWKFLKLGAAKQVPRVLSPLLADRIPGRCTYDKMQMRGGWGKSLSPLILMVLIVRRVVKI